MLYMSYLSSRKAFLYFMIGPYCENFMKVNTQKGCYVTCSKSAKAYNTIKWQCFLSLYDIKKWSLNEFISNRTNIDAWKRCQLSWKRLSEKREELGLRKKRELRTKSHYVVLSFKPSHSCLLCTQHQWMEETLIFITDFACLTWETLKGLDFQRANAHSKKCLKMRTQKLIWYQSLLKVQDKKIWLWDNAKWIKCS